MSVNPIQYILVNSVQAVIPAPSRYEYILEDVSGSKAGRMADTTMVKQRIGSVIGINLTWTMLDDANAAKVMRAFQQEYVTISYKDILVGGFTEKTFYVGNRTAPMFNATLGLWENISFNIRIVKAMNFNLTTNAWVDNIDGE